MNLTMESTEMLSSESVGCETAFAAAYRRAGGKMSPRRTFEAAAFDAMKASDQDIMRAAKKLAADKDIARICVDWCLRLLKQGRLDELLGEGHNNSDDQLISARSQQPVPEQVNHLRDMTSGKFVAPQTVEGGDGQFADAYQSQQSFASPPSPKADRSGRKSFESQKLNARPVRPTQAQRHAALASRAETAISVLDTYKLSNGMIVGHLRFGQLEGLRTSSLRDAMLIRQIQKHGVADPSALVKDALKAEDFQRMIQKAAEFADAA